MSLSPLITMPHSCSGPLEDHFSPRESSLPLSVRSCICSWTLATIDAITCDSMLRLHGMIVQTLDDVTHIVSVTLMYPLRHVACIDSNTAVVLCSTLQHARNCPPSCIEGQSRQRCAPMATSVNSNGRFKGMGTAVAPIFGAVSVPNRCSCR